MEILNELDFTKGAITKRDRSFFMQDIDDNHEILLSKIQGKRILVIGGAGSIGSSFIRAILFFRPVKLVVVDTDENRLTELTRDLRSSVGQYLPKEYYTYPMSFGDQVFFKMFLAHKPFDIVANFAAHKHVRSEKDIFSIEAMIENNIIRAKALLDLLAEYKPEHFFCVSTDKAANPVSIMGASKKIMEELIMSYKNVFHVTTARFANVAFSNGSLLDGFMYRVSKNQALSCPSDIQRFFVSLEESGQICMLACLLGKSGDIFFPKFGKADLVSFRDITVDFLTTIKAGIKPCSTEEQARSWSKNISSGADYPVYFFESDTSGEKLYEEFYTDEDDVDILRYKSVGVIINSRCMTMPKVKSFFYDLNALFSSNFFVKDDIVQLLKKYLPTFQHAEKGRDLDSKM